MRKLHSLTVIAPFYNEAETVDIFYQTLRTVVDTLEVSADFVFVDDGSRDSTLQHLNTLAADDSRITVLAFARNFGHQAALTAGIDYAFGEAVIMMDSDLQHPPSYIPAMIAAYEQDADVVFMVRQQAEKLGLFKRISTHLFYTLLKRVGNIEVVPGAADFRLVSQPALNTLREMREQHRYLRGMVSWVGFKQTMLQYQQADRFAGQPTYTWRKSLKLARHGLFSFSTVPLDLITWLGIIMTVSAVVYLVYTVIVFFTGISVPGWSSVIAVVLILGGVQLISLGIIAQYIGMIYEQVKARPLYVLKHKTLSTPLQGFQFSTQSQGTLHDPSTDELRT